LTGEAVNTINEIERSCQLSHPSEDIKKRLARFYFFGKIEILDYLLTHGNVVTFRDGVFVDLSRLSMS